MSSVAAPRRPRSKSAAPKVGFVSLGCPKALVDSERILTQLRAEGYLTAPTYDAADVVIVNTCGFIDSAVTESLDAIGEAMNENGKVIVTGCLGAKSGMIRERFPDLLSISGPQDFVTVMDAVHRAVPYQHDPFVDLLPAKRAKANDVGVKLTPKHYAYLKISEGCNHKCSFCIIPSMRGRLDSRLVTDVLKEAERLVKAGVKELLVISQDTSAYGSDLKYAGGQWRGQDYRTSMLDLCRGLGELGVWVRLHYVYPYPHVDAIIPLMAEGKILPYLDIPFQHGSPSVLKRMKRPAFAENTLERIKAWRKICPELVIRSTFIVGFPGETEAEFEELLDWLKIAQLDRVGCFQYSPVEGATANELADPVPEDVKAERYERFMKTQARISKARLKKMVGRTLDILVDEIDEDGVLVGRSYADAPEIDGKVYLSCDFPLKPGQMVRAKVLQSNEHDLHAEAIED
ncbi:MAG: rimO [Hydrocarboniphaga sp.]|uniref:30S ribosomal protein S12 methylthiotransferase RimO n=1 Tax=Hydrocarboniphaga sp. TaxID=2033016 RepID=UPI00260C4489|nr:30S ribosomal protein S12 methylthiotransferase RimO [Hydrocarboniphaga sp.]MDB5971865.1 rimO [Hydrocarboniphaga sp.]